LRAETTGRPLKCGSYSPCYQARGKPGCSKLTIPAKFLQAAQRVSRLDQIIDMNRAGETTENWRVQGSSD
jgi:hypothetical protein